MSCDCGNLPNCIKHSETGENFPRVLEPIAERQWLRLYRCTQCDTHWQLDVDDRSDFAIKVPEPDKWPDFDDKPYRREYFIRFHGGEGKNLCTWVGCRKQALMDMPICVDHAYPEFAPSPA